MPRRVAIVIAMALLLAWPAQALADGDPASDILVFDEYFLPYGTATAKPLEAQLRATTRQAKRAGHEVRVAVIAAPEDLGSYPDLLGQPQKYALLLADELGFAFRGPVVTVMARGFGLAGRVSAAQRKALAAVPAAGSADHDALARAAVAAVAAVSGVEAAQAVAVGSTTSSGGESHGGGNALAIVVAASSAALLVLLGGALWWSRTRGEGDPPGPL